jgi:hypothetical protein|tara:strand:+ start:1950 stop:2198 length:249 start_codon:yes stop_codon:yes gene_type:complete
MPLTESQELEVVRRFSRAAYADSPATSDTDTILAAVRATDVLVEAAQGQWIDSVPQPFADEANDQQKAQLISAVIEGRTGMS